MTETNEVVDLTQNVVEKAVELSTGQKIGLAIGGTGITALAIYGGITACKKLGGTIKGWFGKKEAKKTETEVNKQPEVEVVNS